MIRTRRVSLYLFSDLDETDMGPSVQERVLYVLEQVTQIPETRRNLALRLFDSRLVDSIQMVDLMVALSENFSIYISPTEVGPDTWATPADIVVDIERRLAAASDKGGDYR